MTALIKCQPKHLQCGDMIVLHNQLQTIVAIDGPDHIGTYDVAVVDNAGHKHMEFVYDTVTIAM
jgi:hypothetical protein